MTESENKPPLSQIERARLDDERDKLIHDLQRDLMRKRVEVIEARSARKEHGWNMFIVGLAFGFMGMALIRLAATLFKAVIS